MISIKTYYQLAKPGIIYGNLLSTIAGFFLASKFHINLFLFIEVLLGIACIIGSGCVFNNYIDKDIDLKMARTKNRSIPIGEISGTSALIYGTILGILGFGVLALFTNALTVFLGFIGFFTYVVVYGIAKRTTIHGTLIGGIAGAMPLVAGYTAVSNRIDTAAIILFFIMTFWQMPHFFAIATHRLKDYTEADLMIWPVKKGVESTKKQILFYTICFVITSLLLTVFTYKGYIYFILILILGVCWIWLGIEGFKTSDTTKWARKMFLFSLIILLSLCFLIAIPFI